MAYRYKPQTDKVRIVSAIKKVSQICSLSLKKFNLLIGRFKTQVVVCLTLADKRQSQDVIDSNGLYRRVFCIVILTLSNINLIILRKIKCCCKSSNLFTHTITFCFKGPLLMHFQIFFQFSALVELSKLGSNKFIFVFLNWMANCHTWRSRRLFPLNYIPKLSQ